MKCVFGQTNHLVKLSEDLPAALSTRAVHTLYIPAQLSIYISLYISLYPKRVASASNCSRHLIESILKKKWKMIIILTYNGQLEAWEQTPKKPPLCPACSPFRFHSHTSPRITQRIKRTKAQKLKAWNTWELLCTFFSIPAIHRVEGYYRFVLNENMWAMYMYSCSA